MALAKKKDGNRLSLGMKCGECIHFNTGPKSALYTDRCSNLGRKAYGKACQGYNPDFTQLNRASEGLDGSMQVAKFADGLNSTQKKILAFSLIKQANLEKLGYKFGQRVWIYLDPTVGLSRNAAKEVAQEDLDYLENYYKAYVIATMHLGDGEYEVYLASSVTGKPDYYISVYRERREKNPILFSWPEYKEIKEELIEAGKKFMPKKLRKRLDELHQWKHVELEGKTIDDANPEWFVNTSHTVNSEGETVKKDKRVKFTKRTKVKGATNFENLLKGGKAARKKLKAGTQEISLSSTSDVKKKVKKKKKKAVV